MATTVHELLDGGPTGQDAPRSLGIFATAAGANTVKAALAVRTSRVYAVQPVTLYTNAQDFADNSPDAVKVRALAKLTEADKAALGLM